MSEGTIFVSYSRKNRAFLERWVTVQIDALHQGAAWTDAEIEPGAGWYAEIQAAMQRAKVAILVVSAEFLASKFIAREEVPELLRRRREDGLAIFPLILSACYWQGKDWLTELEVRPSGDRTLEDFDGPARKRFMATFVGEIAEKLKPQAEPGGFSRSLPMVAKRAVQANWPQSGVSIATSTASALNSQNLRALLAKNPNLIEELRQAGMVNNSMLPQTVPLPDDRGQMP